MNGSQLLVGIVQGPMGIQLVNNLQGANSTEQALKLLVGAVEDLRAQWILERAKGSDGSIAVVPASAVAAMRG